MNSMKNMYKNIDGLYYNYPIYDKRNKIYKNILTESRIQNYKKIIDQLTYLVNESTLPGLAKSMLFSKIDTNKDDVVSKRYITNSDPKYAQIHYILKNILKNIINTFKKYNCKYNKSRLKTISLMVNNSREDFDPVNAAVKDLYKFNNSEEQLYDKYMHILIDIIKNCSYYDDAFNKNIAMWLEEYRCYTIKNGTRENKEYSPLSKIYFYLSTILIYYEDRNYDLMPELKELIDSINSEPLYIKYISTHEKNEIFTFKL